MAGFFSSLFRGGGSNSRQRRRPAVPGPAGTTGTAAPRIGDTAPRTDARKPTANAIQTGRTAITRAEYETKLTNPPPVPGLIPDPITAAHQAAARTRKRGRTQRASALLGSSKGTGAAALLNKRTLIGY